MMAIGFAANCFPEGSWPKLIGFGQENTSVIGVSRCSSSGELALAIQTKEADFVGNVQSELTLSIAKFDPASETYNWFKVLEDVLTNE